jgi:hypothetical protein
MIVHLDTWVKIQHQTKNLYLIIFIKYIIEMFKALKDFLFYPIMTDII